MILLIISVTLSFGDKTFHYSKTIKLTYNYNKHNIILFYFRILYKDRSHKQIK